MEPITLMILGAGALAGYAALKSSSAAQGGGSQPWVPPDPPDASSAAVGAAGYVTAIDPRVDAAHVIGVLPCPTNPSPPVGWAYWTSQLTVTANLGVFASSILNGKYPMGSFVQAIVDGQLVGARVEWHTEQGATGARGCFRGVNLMSTTG